MQCAVWKRGTSKQESALTIERTRSRRVLGTSRNNGVMSQARIPHSEWKPSKYSSFLSWDIGKIFPQLFIPHQVPVRKCRKEILSSEASFGRVVALPPDPPIKASSLPSPDSRNSSGGARGLSTALPEECVSRCDEGRTPGSGYL